MTETKNIYRIITPLLNTNKHFYMSENEAG